MADDIDYHTRILTLAGQMGSPTTPAEKTALNRGWIDADGNPTEDGRKLVDEIDGQQGTRSVFR